MPGSDGQKEDLARLVRRLRSRRDLSLDMFEDMGLLGRGSFGEVRKVRLRQGPTHAVFAIKSLSKDPSADERVQAQLRNERAILAQLRHPFIVELAGFFEDENKIHLLLEYVSGGELFKRLRAQIRFSEDVTLFYGSEILLALRYLHLNDIVYRDLKFENLMLDRNGHVKLVDFGFSKVLKSGRTATLCGTQAYFSPEMLVSGSEGYGKASDWWAFGVVLFEMSVGAHPFYDKDPFVMYQKIVSMEFSLPRFLSPPFRCLLRQILNKEAHRLGARDDGQAILEHEFFQAVRFEEIVNRRIASPWVPPTDSPCRVEVTYSTNATSENKDPFYDF